MKTLNIGCGPRKTPGAINLDINPDYKPDVVWNLNRFPYPFRKDEFGRVIANHVIEHLDDWPRCMQELHRITKNRGIIEIRVPHFSSHDAYGTIGHKNFFSTGIFRQIPGFKIIKTRLNYFLTNYKMPAYKRIISAIYSFPANLSRIACERFWCYYVGGFAEVYVEMEVIK